MSNEARCETAVVLYDRGNHKALRYDDELLSDSKTREGVISEINLLIHDLPIPQHADAGRWRQSAILSAENYCGVSR
jgi:hypothetical protein